MRGAVCAAGEFEARANIHNDDAGVELFGTKLKGGSSTPCPVRAPPRNAANLPLRRQPSRRRLLAAAFSIVKLLSPALETWSEGKELAIGLTVVLLIAVRSLAARWLARSPKGPPTPA